MGFVTSPNNGVRRLKCDGERVGVREVVDSVHSLGSAEESRLESWLPRWSGKSTEVLEEVVYK